MAGKKRAARNAFRHGLSVRPAATEALSGLLEERAVEISGESKDSATLDFARAVAEADLELQRVRRVLVLRCASDFGQLCSAGIVRPGSVRELKADEQGVLSVSPGTMPPEEAQRSSEAIRPSVQHLRKLYRYERRAAARRDRAARALMKCLKGEDLAD